MITDKTPLKAVYRLTRTGEGVLKHKEVIEGYILKIVSDNPVESAATAALRPLTTDVVTALSEQFRITKFRAYRQSFVRAVNVLASDKYRGEGTKANVLKLFKTLVELAEVELAEKEKESLP